MLNHVTAPNSLFWVAVVPSISLPMWAFGAPCSDQGVLYQTSTTCRGLQVTIATSMVR
ncbi:hypothetical protein BDV09DRAFT_179282 [Aspergillus tetrazonus]